MRLFDRDIREPDDLGPFRHLAGQGRRNLRRGLQRDRDALTRRAGHQTFLGYRHGHRSIEPVDDRGRGSGRRKQRAEGVGLNTRNAAFGERRQGRQKLGALRARQGQRPDAAGFDLLLDQPRQRCNRQVNPAGQVLPLGTSATVRIKVREPVGGVPWEP